MLSMDPAMSSKGLRVLIVEDERLIADGLALILNKSGHDALAVYSGLEAVHAARVFNPHTLLADVMMPGMNGFELARHFATNYPKCKVLLMSEDSRALEKACGMPNQGFLSILTKPVKPQSILDFVGSCCEALEQRQ